VLSLLMWHPRTEQVLQYIQNLSSYLTEKGVCSSDTSNVARFYIWAIHSRCACNIKWKWICGVCSQTTKCIYRLFKCTVVYLKLHIAALTYSHLQAWTKIRWIQLCSIRLQDLVILLYNCIQRLLVQAWRWFYVRAETCNFG
jgi:hypothetical protein